MPDEHKEVRNGVTAEGQGLSEEDESRLNEAADYINHNGRGGHAAPPVHQQPLGPIVRWERFLPVRSLKVLLVEDDDSTRQVVTALLRNCSYEVTAAANGLQAWKILEDLTNHVDLVLTEVVMPCLSGFGLLCKIMSHKTRKNVPVIMMSSYDSMGTVFKCLSRGAVDFLVKPIRKNELKNLWQHVWRRCHSSSGSGSESGIQGKKSAKSKSDDDSDNNIGSNDEDDNGSTGLNVTDGSDNGSETQSSWTKRAVEADSPQPMSPSDQLADPHDSTCAQVIHPKTETFCNEWTPQSTTKECQNQKESAGNEFMCKDLEIGVRKNLDMQHESYATGKVSTNLTGPSVDKLPETDPKKDIDDGVLERESSNVVGKPSSQVALTGGIANSCAARLVIRATEVPNCFSKISERRDKTMDGFKEVPPLELSLKRLRPTEEGGITTNDDRNVLRHSDLSAFSRYNTSAASTQAPTGYRGSCSLPLDDSSEAVKTESTYNMISNSNAAPLKYVSNGSSNNNDMGSTTKNVSMKPSTLKEKSACTSTVRCIQPSAFHPVQHGTAATQQVVQEKIDNVAAAAMVGQPTGVHQVQVEHHHHHYHHHHYHVHSMQQQLQPPPAADDGDGDGDGDGDDELSLNNTAAAAPHCRSSFVKPMEGNAANYSLNGSNSGSNYGSNGQNGCYTAAIGGAVNMENDNGNAENGVGGGNRSSNAVDQNQLTQREAALKKFRQKRKERNFEKKVRYQSRKRLAEQRPRMRGQFVRQTEYENASREADSSVNGVAARA